MGDLCKADARGCHEAGEFDKEKNPFGLSLLGEGYHYA